MTIIDGNGFPPSCETYIMRYTMTSQKQRVLNALSKGTKMSAKTLASRAKAPYSSVRKRIHDLREDGFNIETVTTSGTDGATKTVYQML